jgi:hypothetical protein
MEKQRSISNLQNYLPSINSKNKRPPSLSESYLYDIDDLKKNNLLYDLSSTKSLDESFITETTINDTSVNDTSINEEKYYSFHYNDKCEMIINKLILFSIHLFLISIFELIFFYNYVTKYEDNAIVNIFSDIVDSSTQSCKLLNNTDKLIINYLLNIILNETEIKGASDYNYNIRKNYNQQQLIIAIMYFIILFFINISILLLNYYYYKKKINYKGIIIDNLIMITFLGFYELLFFSTIVFKYQTISSQELTYNIYDKVINTC